MCVDGTTADGKPTRRTIVRRVMAGMTMLFMFFLAITQMMVLDFVAHGLGDGSFGLGFVIANTTIGMAGFITSIFTFMLDLS